MARHRGVVNVSPQLVKDDFEIRRISRSSMTGAYDKGDGETNHQDSLTAGASFAQDRGNAIINLRYDDQGGVFARDRAPLNTGSDVFYYGLLLR